MVAYGVALPFGVSRGRFSILARREWGLLAVLALALIYLANAWTPSHYGQTAASLGIGGAGPVFGESRPIRSDEWIVATPYVQIAVASGFGDYSTVSPYHETLNSFVALPSRDWAMGLKPDLWGFLVLPPAYAYSFHFTALALGFIVGFTLLLRQFGCSPGVALALGLTLFFSQFVQLWWTNNAPVFAYAPWPVLAYLWRGPWLLRALAIGVSVAVWLIGQLYPPFVLASAFGMGLFILAFRPRELATARLVPALAGAAVGCAVAWLHYREIFPVIAATVYPVRRVLDGGGVPLMYFVSHLFPHFTTSRYEPLALWPTNACEISVVGSFLPLAMLTFGDHRRNSAWLAANAGRLVVWLLGLGVMAAGWSWRDSPLRRAGFVAAALAAWLVSKLAVDPAGIEFDRFDPVVVLVLLAVMFAHDRWPARLPLRRAILAVVLASTFLTFGQFNPVQSARPIFEPRESPVLTAYRDYATANPKGWVIAPGIHGAAVNAVGIPAINHTLFQPQLAFFRRAYPDMAPEAFNQVFNRYMHVVPEVRWEPVTPQADVVLIPPDPFAIPLAVEAAGAAGPVEGMADTFQAVKLGPHRWGVSVGGWANWAGVAPGQSLQVAVVAPGLRMAKASAYRLPRPAVLVERNDRAAFAAGFGSRLEIETDSELAEFPKAALRFGSVDPVRGARTLAMTF